MPKTFPILIDVEEIAVGRVMRILNKLPGVAKLHLDMGGGKPKANGPVANRPPYRKFSSKAEEDILAALYTGKQLTSAQLRDVFVAKGRAPGSVASSLTQAQRDGDIARAKIGDGWVLTKKARDRLRWQHGDAVPKKKTAKKK